MIFLIWLALCLVASALILLMPVLWLLEVYRRFSGPRLVACPENRQASTVTLDARHAALSGMHGLPDVRLADCTQWPEHADCGRGCLAEAAETEPYPARSARRYPSRARHIYHLPVLLAAFAVWCLGTIWHAQYLFRPQWMDAAGLTHDQVKQMVWWISPHLLPLAACILFAYGVAAMLAVWRRKGVLPGILMAAALCGAVVAANLPGIAALPHDLLKIEAAYLALAAVTAGAIVGGLFDKLVLPPH